MILVGTSHAHKLSEPVNNIVTARSPLVKSVQANNILDDLTNWWKWQLFTVNLDILIDGEDSSWYTYGEDKGAFNYFQFAMLKWMQFLTRIQQMLKEQLSMLLCFLVMNVLRLLSNQVLKKLFMFLINIIVSHQWLHQEDYWIWLVLHIGKTYYYTTIIVDNYFIIHCHFILCVSDNILQRNHV